MKTYELLQAYKAPLQMLQQHNIDVSDIKHLEMFKEFLRMEEEGHKRTYIVTYLSDVYEVGQRTVYRVINKFQNEVDMNLLV